VRDALKNYLSLASGLTEVGRQRAVAASKALVAQGEATAEQVGSLAEDLVQTSRNNRAMVTALVRNEVDKALGKVGLATADEVQRLTKRLQAIESSLREATGRAVKAATKPAATKPAAQPAATRAPARKAATKAPAKPAQKAAAKVPAKAVRKPAAKKAPAKAVRKPAAKKAPAKRAARS
jgi:polyhydroxyalkanoate synthesis regulator phasin